MNINLDILDPLFKHLGRNCSARDLVSLKCATKSWAQMVSDSVNIIASSRCQDDTRDWYFPLRFELDRSRNDGAEGSNSFIWSGVHHPSGKIHSLPPLPPFNVPRMLWKSGIYDHRLGRLVASAGGLLLVANKYDGAEMVSSTTSDSLTVINPLTKRWRPLPAFDTLGIFLRQHGSFEAHMMVDEKANSYKVILRYLNFASIYTSTSDSWQHWDSAVAYEYQPPLGVTPQLHVYPRGFKEVPYVLAAGKLYLAQLKVEGFGMLTVMLTYDPSDSVIQLQGFISLIEFDYEAGTQKPPLRYALRAYFPHPMPDEWNGFGIISFQVKLVGCRNGLYAILPAHLDLERTVGVADGVPNLDRVHTYRAYGYLPMQFYVLQLSGTDMDCGRLLIRIPSTVSEEEKRSRQTCDKVGHQYWCIGRGQVIWLLWDDYLVEYDVVTGISTTRILPNSFCGPQYEHAHALDFRARILPNRSFGPQYEHALALDYRASFHMTP